MTTDIINPEILEALRTNATAAHARCKQLATELAAAQKAAAKIDAAFKAYEEATNAGTVKTRTDRPTTSLAERLKSLLATAPDTGWTFNELFDAHRRAHPGAKESKTRVKETLGRLVDRKLLTYTRDRYQLS